MNIYQISEDVKYSDEVEYDYNVVRDCYAKGCRDEGICRCGKIEDIEIKKVNRTVLNSLVKKIKLRKNAKVKETEGRFILENEQFFMYCVDRLFTINKLYDGDVWDINVRGGYYGQEINSVSPPLSFSDDVIKIAKLDPQQRIKYVLTREYGYLHDRLKDKSFVEKTVSTKNLVVGNEYRKTDGKLYECSEYNLPIGIYLKEKDKYVLMDGYNRFYGIVPNKETVQIIIAE
jgi:hypothetical protein